MARGWARVLFLLQVWRTAGTLAELQALSRLELAQAAVLLRRL